MNNSPNSEATTQGIKIQVEPEYVPEQSSPELGKFLFAYRVTITNEGEKWAKLISRHWIIINADGDREDVEGPGVVGYTPELSPGESFEYTSFCTLNTNWGTMEGSYQMIRENGATFDVDIARFYLYDPAMVSSAH
jgi:ApaG protein